MTMTMQPAKVQPRTMKVPESEAVTGRRNLKEPVTNLILSHWDILWNIGPQVRLLTILSTGSPLFHLKAEQPDSTIFTASATLDVFGMHPARIFPVKKTFPNVNPGKPERATVQTHEKVPRYVMRKAPVLNPATVLALNRHRQEKMFPTHCQYPGVPIQ